MESSVKYVVHLYEICCCLLPEEISATILWSSTVKSVKVLKLLFSDTLHSTSSQQILVQPLNRRTLNIEKVGRNFLSFKVTT